jgi:hypothetical protein
VGRRPGRTTVRAMKKIIMLAAILGLGFFAAKKLKTT